MPFTLIQQQRWEEAKTTCEVALTVDHTNYRAAIAYLLADHQCADLEALSKLKTPFWDNDYYRLALRFAPEEEAAALEQCRLVCAYALADDAFWQGETVEDYLACGEQFSALGEYRDAPKRYYECQAVAEKLRLEQTYREATEKMATGKANAMDEAKYLFTTLGDYRDAAEKAELCADGAQGIWRRQERNHRVLLVILAVLVAAAAGIIVSRFNTRYAACQAQAAEIAAAMSGRTYSYVYLHDDDFVEQYSAGTMVEGTVYYRTVIDRTLRFNRDGTVFYRTRDEKTVLAYPAEMEEPKDHSTEHSGTYESYGVAVTMEGEIYLVLGEARFPMTVDANNTPTAIYDYYTEPLT